MAEKYFITIGRQFGSKGHSIGQMLAEKLNIAFYDKEIIHIASEDSGLGKEFFERADEKTSHSLIGGLFGLRNSPIDEVYANGYLSNETLFNIQAEIIRELAEKESAVFVGRCADYILSKKNDLINIFVYADLNDRIKTISEMHNLSESKSRSLIHKADKQRASYYDYFSGKTWGAAESYHLCVNSSFLGVDGTVDLIYDVVEKKFKLSK